MTKWFVQAKEKKSNLEPQWLYELEEAVIDLSGEGDDEE